MFFQTDDLIWKGAEEQEQWEKLIEFVLSISEKKKVIEARQQPSLSRSLVNENKWESILEIFNVDWKRTGLINKHFRVLWISTGQE